MAYFTTIARIISALFIFVHVQPAHSADPTDAFKKAARALKGETGGSSQELRDFDAARDAAIDAWSSVPFQIRKLALTEEKATGSGMYKERSGSAYKTGDSIFIYLEPVGYGWKEIGKELYTFGFVTDLVIKSGNGEVVFDKKALIDGEFASHKKNMEAYMNASIDIEALPTGDYTLEFTVRDKVSNATTEVTQAFSYTAANSSASP